MYLCSLKNQKKINKDEKKKLLCKKGEQKKKFRESDDKTLT